MRKVVADFMVVVMTIGLLMGIPAKGSVVEAASGTYGGITVECTGVSDIEDAVSYDPETMALSIQTSQPVTLSGQTQTGAYIYIGDDTVDNVNLILSDVKIYNMDLSGIVIKDNYTKDVTITLKGANEIQSFNVAGIQKNGSYSEGLGKLKILGNGSLEVMSYGTAAGIGSTANNHTANIEIAGGQLDIYANSTGAAIGGGAKGDAEYITISGGIVNAYVLSNGVENAKHGAAIGGGGYGDGTNISITGGTVTARPLEIDDSDYLQFITKMAYTDNCCDAGAGIGGGYAGNGTEICISGGTITAVGDEDSAGIGSGAVDASGTDTNISISGGFVTASAKQNKSDSGVGIGSGTKDTSNSSSNVNVTITGGTIKATGATCAPGIGAARRANSNTYISGGSVCATAGKEEHKGYKSDTIGLGGEQKYYNTIVTAMSSSLVYSKENKVPVELKKMSGYASNTKVVPSLIYELTEEEYTEYGVKDIMSDETGTIYPYLIDGVVVKDPSESDSKVTFDVIFKKDGQSFANERTVTIVNATNDNNQYTVTTSDNITYTFNGVFAAGTYDICVDGNVVKRVIFDGSSYADIIINEYSVFTEECVNGTITAANSVGEGKDFAFKVVPNENYEVSEVSFKVGDGEYQSVSGSYGTYTIPANAINDSITIKATFSLYVFSVIAESSSNGTIKLTSLTAYKDEPYMFSVSADDGYVISKVSYKVGDGTYQTLQGMNGSYTIPGNVITDEISIKAEFTESKGTAIDMSGMTWNYTTPYYYKNESYTVQLSSELPTGVKSVSYTNNVQSDIGTYTATAEFTCLAGYYAEPMSCTWEIKEYTPTLNLKYNDSTTLKDWYTGAVVITEENHLIAESPTATEFVESIELSDNKAKTLYFKHKTDKYITTEGKTVSVDIDNVAPTGSIVLDGVSYSEINAKESKICHLADNQITINATDSNSEVAKVEYATSNESFTTQDAIEKAGLTWQMGTPSFVSGTALYVRIKDKAGNARYISTPVITNDALPPTMKATVSNVTASSADYSIEFSENSNYAYMLVKDTETKPSTAEVIQKNGITGSGTLKTGTFNDLAPNTKYSICAVSDDGMKTLSGSDNKNQTDVEVLTSFTTAEESLDNIVFKYNGSTILKEWYQGSVEISADGYSISDSKSGGFGDTYTISSTTSDTVLYLKNKKWNTVIPTGKVVEVKIDNTKPTGSIVIDGMTYNTLNASENKVCHLSSTELDFASSDKESGIAKVEYALSSQLLTTESAVATAITSWSTETPEFASGKAIYVRITDIAGNVTYISTPVIINDEQAPVIDISISSKTSTSVQFNIMMSDNLVSDIDYAYVLLKSGDTAPEGWDDVAADGKSGTSKGKVTDIFENLEPNTEYVLYVVANDGLTNLNGTINNPNYSSVQKMPVRTSKHSANVSDQTFLVKSGVSDSYTYDLTQLLTASNVNVSQMGNITYSAVAESGEILSNTGDMVVNGNVLTIPVKSNFDAGKEQYITVTIQGEHYEEITVDLIVKSVSKTPVTIDGVSVIDTTYNSEVQGYTGDIKWKDNGQACSVSNTKVEYEGINDTTYGPSEDAPVDAGDYKITFTVDDSNYEGTATYYYTIHKMDLSAEMLDTTWYIGANKASDLENSVVVNGQTYTVEVKNYSDKVEPKYEGTCSASEIGGYEAKVSFDFIDESDVTNYKLPASMTLYWKIIAKTQVALTGVSIADAVYNGESHGYTGTIEWKNGETVCDVANTTVEYVGINDTVYGPTADAPSNAGDYKVTFTVEDALYEGTQSYWFTIAKADLTSEMTNVAWYINGERIDGYTKTVVHNGSTYSVELKNYSEKLDVIYSGICSGAELGDYEAIANFEFKDSSDAMNYKLPTSTSLYWKISSKMQVSLSGITVGDVTYNGEAQGYTGSIEWKDGEEVCDVAGTKIEYSGTGSTTYGPSEVAPTNAGSYKVTFTVEDTEYEGTQSYWYAIEKANLNSEMADTKWYLDEKVVNGESASIMRDGQEHQISVKDYSQKVKPVYSGICNAVDCGEYTAIVDFEFEDTAYADNYLIPNSMALDWSIVDKYTPDMSKVKWCYQQGDIIADYIEGTTQLTDNGMEYIVSVTGLPEGVVAEYSGTYKASVAGNYSATVTFRNTDDTKYHNPNPTTMSMNWSIVTPTSDPSDKPQTGEPGDNPQTPDQGDNPQVIAPEVGASKEVGGQKYTVATTSSTGGTVQYSGPVNKNVTSVDIPATVVIDGQTYTVTMITANAFNGCKSMASVKIGGNVTSIGTGAFKGCVKLKNVVIPASVTSIGANAFSGCKAMTKVTIGKNVKAIGNGAFSGCTKLSTVSMNTSAKLTKIGDKAFYKCTSLKKITIPKNVTTIGKSAFEGCRKLKTITIKSKKLKKVGSKAIKNIHKKATIKCPGKSYVKKYKKLFKSKTGYKKTMKLK